MGKTIAELRKLRAEFCGAAMENLRSACEANESLAKLTDDIDDDTLPALAVTQCPGCRAEIIIFAQGFVLFNDCDGECVACGLQFQPGAPCPACDDPENDPELN
jgi:hypothetical protein